VLLIGRRRNPPPIVLPSFNVSVHLNAMVGRVSERMIRSVFRTPIGDWAAELELDGKEEVEIFDHHPTVATMRALKAGGTYIADDVLDQGAEGDDIRSHVRRADDR
jgi:hypothetical protein